MNGISCLRQTPVTAENPLSRPKHLVPAPNPVVTQIFYYYAGLKISVAIEKTSVATKTAQHAWEPCRDTGPESFVARSCLLRSPRPSCELVLETLSRHERPCHDTGLEKPCCDIIFFVATKDPKWAVALPSPLHHRLPFSFLSKISYIQHTTTFLVQR